MCKSAELNFAGQIIQRLRSESCLIDAATGEKISASKIPKYIIGFATRFISAGLNPGDRIIIGCFLNPASTLAYLGAIYAGIVPVPLDERALVASGETILKSTNAKGLWVRKDVNIQWANHLGKKLFIGYFETNLSETLSPHPIKHIINIIATNRIKIVLLI